jgi:hypothetical protein
MPAVGGSSSEALVLGCALTGSSRHPNEREHRGFSKRKAAGPLQHAGCRHQ